MCVLTSLHVVVQGHVCLWRPEVDLFIYWGRFSLWTNERPILGSLASQLDTEIHYFCLLSDGITGSHHICLFGIFVCLVWFFIFNVFYLWNYITSFVPSLSSHQAPICPSFLSFNEKFFPLKYTYISKCWLDFYVGSGNSNSNTHNCTEEPSPQPGVYLPKSDLFHLKW